MDFVEGRIKIDDVHEPEGTITLPTYEAFEDFLRDGMLVVQPDGSHPYSGDQDSYKRLCKVNLPKFGESEPQPAPLPELEKASLLLESLFGQVGWFQE